MPERKHLSALPDRIADPEDFHNFLTLYALDSDLQSRVEYVFRGHHHAARADLSTSLMRTTCAKAVPPDQEQLLLSRFRSYGASLIPPHLSLWDVMAMAQHHGVPTRYLDWTYSPLIALHFAVRHAAQRTDGAVWVAEPYAFNLQAPDALRQPLQDQKLLFYSTAILANACPSTEEFDALATSESGERRDFAIFIEPPTFEARIANQFSFFSVSSAPSIPLDQCLPRTDYPCIKRVEIDAKMAPFIRSFLDQNIVTERILFPGLDGIGEFLKRLASDHFPLGSCDYEEDDDDVDDRARR